MSDLEFMQMTNTDRYEPLAADYLADIRARHHAGRLSSHCATCGLRLPCQTTLLLDEIDHLRGRLVRIDAWTEREVWARLWDSDAYICDYCSQPRGEMPRTAGCVCEALS